jgi:hypothetical protein
LTAASRLAALAGVAATCFAAATFADTAFTGKGLEAAAFGAAAFGAGEFKAGDFAAGAFEVVLIVFFTVFFTQGLQVRTRPQVYRLGMTRASMDSWGACQNDESAGMRAKTSKAYGEGRNRLVSRR